MRVLFYVCMHNVLEFVANFVTFAILQVKNYLGLMVLGISKFRCWSPNL